MNLITDRTWDDVLQGTDKGHYGPGDLNRVEQAVEELYAMGKALGLAPVGQIKTNWGVPGPFSAESWPTQGQMQRYLANITHLCEAVALEKELPVTMENLTIDGANSIEQALLLTYPRLENMLQNLRFSGEIFAGEENVL